MTLGGYTLSSRILALILGAVGLILIIGFTVHSCDKRRSQASQERVEDSQAAAASNSAADAIATVTRSGEAAAASEEQSRQAEREIRAAEGANAPVNPAVRDAGIRALCKRKTYANDPRCRRP